MALRELLVENLAVIESVRLPLARGFTVVTGETGAGKSLVVDALALALGARASAELVRHGTSGARVEAIFDAPADLLKGSDSATDPGGSELVAIVAAGDGMVIVHREVGADGRSVARINDRTVTIGTLAALGSRLGEIHGQHEQQRLQASERQLVLLDRFGGHVSLREDMRTRYAAWRSVVAQLDERIVEPHEAARRAELLRHQVDEIAAAQLRPGEDVELEEELRRAQHAEEIARSAAAATRALRDEEGALDGLGAARVALHGAAAHDPRFAELVDRTEALVSEATDLARDAAALGEQLELDPRRQAEADERLALIYELKRKYGGTVQAIDRFAAAAAAELAQLTDQEGLVERLQTEEAARRAELETVATALGTARRAAAERLATAVGAQLPSLGLPAGSFGVDLAEARIGPSGGERVEFVFGPNPGEPPRPLASVASGGEISRLSLAIKLVLATADDTPLLVFDEIDAGVGGRQAGALGDRLRELAAYHQVLCVTHLPQLAARADVHIHVGKRVVAGRTVTDARILGDDERAVELAAMLGGDESSHEAHAAAVALLRAGR